MINALWLLLVVPASAIFGFITCALLSANSACCESNDEEVNTNE